MSARALSNSTLIGTVVAVDADSLWLRHAPAAAPLAFARRALTRVDVSGAYPGRRRRTVLGALEGATIGAVVGANLGGDAGCDDCTGSTVSPRVGLSALFGALGALGGMLAGSVTVREQWHPGRLVSDVP